MINVLRNIFISIGIGFLTYQLQKIIVSSYIMSFLKQNLVSLLVALVAINSATLGIILTKIRDLLDKSGNNGEFTKTKNEMILSIREQIAIICFSIILLLMDDSNWITKNPEIKPLIEVLIIGCFSYALIILYDTAKSVFVILDYDKK